VSISLKIPTVTDLVHRYHQAFFKPPPLSLCGPLGISHFWEAHDKKRRRFADGTALFGIFLTPTITTDNFGDDFERTIETR
jgi:hypothetical protein